MCEEKIVYVVHCVDTEGPLYESLNATFKRLYEAFGIDLDPSIETLKKLQKQEINLDGIEQNVSTFLHPKRLYYNKTWKEIDDMLEKITSSEFRSKYTDSYNNKWIYNWFCVDHVGLPKLNPRRRSLGFHTIYDHYFEYNKKHKIDCDLIQLHFHPLPIIKDMDRSGTNFLGSFLIFKILARKIIDRNYFPTVYRPGYHTERPDANWLLEMWIPFDYGNQSMKKNDVGQPDRSNGRFGDWRRAPLKWMPYHPDIYDYQKEGSCKRYITRCLNMESRIRQITEDDIRDAFNDAQNYGKSLLSFTNHDFRDMYTEIDKIWNMINNVSNDFKDIKFKMVNSIDGIRNVMNIERIPPPEFKIKITKGKTSSLFEVQSKNDIFGPQPFLAIKTKTQDYIWENFDFQTDNTWTYTFDFDTLDIGAVEKIGVAANNAYGIAEIVVLDVDTNKIVRTVLNDDIKKG